MKKILYSIMALAMALFTLQSCEDVPAPYDIPENGDTPDKPVVEIKEITCAQAMELCNALEDGATSEETYSITGYITDVFANVNKGQQSFWLSDQNDGQKMVQAYWANLPEGVESFTKGSKVTITGKLLKYLKDGEVITEVKNADVEILEQGGGSTPGGDAIAISCAKAVELCNALDDGATSEETYSITGYITDVFANVNKGQQSFWLSDQNDGQKMVQAYWANLPEGVESFTKGSKVTITGKLLKYLKDGEVITEVKNADVEILEQGGGSTPGGDVKHISVSEFLSKKDTNTTYELTGVVKNIQNATYGNFDLVEGDAQIYIYGLLDKDGNAKNFASLGISEGDEVTLTGVYSEFNNSPQIKNAQFVSVKKGQGGGENPGGEDISEFGIFTVAGVNAALPELTTNNYGTQSVETESTWLKFTTGKIEWIACKLCNATDKELGLQMQGNDSDKAKQGFIFNNSAITGGIQKIIITAKTTSSSKYDPNFSLYVGETAHPTENAITVKPSSEVSGNYKVFTYTYDLSSSNFSFFTVWNNFAGALYITKIEVIKK